MLGWGERKKSWGGMKTNILILKKSKKRITGKKKERGFGYE